MDQRLNVSNVKYLLHELTVTTMYNDYCKKKKKMKTTLLENFIGKLLRNLIFY